MPNYGFDDENETETETENENKKPQGTFTRQTAKLQNIFSIPAPVKRLFDLVPIVTYPPEELPQRAPKAVRIPRLYVFITEKDAAAGRPSFNPTCLKWQTFLNIAGIDHRLVSSNNHASPTGILPFLLPGVQPANAPKDSARPIPSNKLVKYVSTHAPAIEEPSSMRYEAYQSLLDQRIRNAWLYTLYLEPLNFNSVAYRLYVSPTSSSAMVQATIAHKLRAAAEDELLKASSIIDTDDLYSEADKAFEALSILLGEDAWFFNGEKPSLFDASVFAYTHLLLDRSLGWKEEKLCRALRRRDNLVKHRERLLVRYYGG
ncbi:hypothetical protein B7494_g3620 [Chlorociboria aeruginascens]|nr:hypothetical protein B7494_g3620 [Chlorociboria aeruginascens]